MPRKGTKKYSSLELSTKADEYIKECKESGKVPFLVGLANRLEIDASTLSDWAKENTAYAKVIKRVKQHAEEGLINKGLNENKPVFPIFLLKSVFQYQEAANKLHVTTNGQLGVVMLPTKQ